MPADNHDLETSLELLIDLVRDMVPGLNEGEAEKEMMLDRLDDIESSLNNR